MRRRLLAVLALGASLLAAPAVPATAAATTTITGPAYVRYWATVTLTGTTSPANSTVAVYFKKAGATAFSARRTLTSDAGGHFSTTYRADATYAYYASANGVASPIGHTRLPSPTCSVSGPAFPAFPPQQPPMFPSAVVSDRFVTLTATNRGLWAGTAFDGAFSLSVMAWRPGSTARTLETIDYENAGGDGFSPSSMGSVRVVGVSPAGVVVASIQHRGGTAFDRVGAAYAQGRAYRLSHAADWTSVDPVGIADSGLIVGSVRVGPVDGGRHYVVTWAGPSAPYHVLLRTGTRDPFPVVNAAGDIVYSNDGGSTPLLRRPDGSTAQLLNSPSTVADPDVQVGGPGGAMVGRGGFQVKSVMVWPASTGSTIVGREVTPPSDDQWVQTVGPRGDLVTGLLRTRHLLTAGGAWVTMPHEYSVRYPITGEAINDRGTVAFTEQDGLIHFLRCS